MTAVERVREESERLLERGKKSLDPKLDVWRASMTNVAEDDWLQERVRLLTDLAYLASKPPWSLKFGGDLMDERVHTGFIGHLERTTQWVDERTPKKKCYLYLQARNTLKTTLAIPHAMQVVLRDRKAREALGTFKEDKAIARLAPIRMYLESEEAALYFPDSTWPRTGKGKRPQTARWTKRALDLPFRTQHHEPTIGAVSYRTAATGDHWTDFSLDDPVNEESVRTQTLKEQCLETWKFLSVASRTYAIRRVFGTFYGDDDLYNWLLQEGIVDELWIVPAVATDNWINANPNMQEHLGEVQVGELLFPGRLTQEALDDAYEELGPYLYGCQYLLDPTSKTARLDAAWLQPFDVDQVPEGCFFYMTGDPSVSKSKGSSEGALVMCAHDYEGHCWIVDFEAGKWNSKEYAERSVTMWSRWKEKEPVAFGLEKIAFQAALHALIDETAEREGLEMRLRDIPGHHTGIYGRVDVLSPYAASGKVHCARHLITEILPQWRRYPDPTGRGMDRLDAIAYQYSTYTKGRMTGRRWVVLPSPPRAVVEAKEKALPKSMAPKVYKPRRSRWTAVRD